jgi:DNA-binding response OmpR family regulator
MPIPVKVIGFDLDPDSLARLLEAFPDGEVQSTSGANSTSLARDWSPDAADLLVVHVGDRSSAALGLCRGLRNQMGRAHVPLLALVPPADDSLIRAALQAGADSCLVLPVYIQDLVTVMARAQAGNQPGRHTLNLNHAQVDDRWRDEGGES